MGKGKKGVPKPTVVATPDPPYMFRMENLVQGTEEFALFIYENTEVRYREIEIEARLAQDPNTTKTGYDFKIVKVKKEKRFPGVYYPEELLPFPIYNLETGTTLTVEPARTAGLQPFVMVNPETKVETLVESPYLIHYELSNRKRYLLNLNLFTDGIFKFKDPDTQEEIIVDITQRVDPLHGEPLPEDNVAVELRDQQVIDKEYFPAYQNFEDELESIPADLREPTEGMPDIFWSFEKSAIELEEHKKTDKSHESIGRSPDQDSGVLEKATGNSLSQGLDLNSPSEYCVRMDPVNKTMVFVNPNDQPIMSEQYRLEMDPVSGTIRIVDHQSLPIDINDFSEQDASDILRHLPDGFHLTRDFDRNHIELVSPSGHILQFDPSTNERVSTERQHRVVYSDRNVRNNLLREKRDGNVIKSTTTLPPKLNAIIGNNKLNSVEEKRNPVEEKYFEDLKMAEGYAILKKTNQLPQEEAKELLKVLIEIIEREKKFVKEAMFKKMKEERIYIETLLKQKQERQKQYIDGLIERTSTMHTNQYDRTDLQQDALDKLQRENENLFEQVDEKIDAANALLEEAFLNEINNQKSLIGKKTNLICCEAVKGILSKKLYLKLDRERELIKRQLRKTLKQEPEQILQYILNAKVSIQDEMKHCEVESEIDLCFCDY